jgi:chromosome segregation ATPase
VVKDQVLVIDKQQGSLRSQQKAVTELIGKLEGSQGELKASLERKKKELAALEARGEVLDTVRQKYQDEISKDEARLSALDAKLVALKAESRRLDSEAAGLGQTHRGAFDKANDAEAYLKYLESLGGDAVPDAEKAKAQKEAASGDVEAARKTLKEAEAGIGQNKADKRNNARATGQTLKDVASTQQMLTEEREALGAAVKELTDVKAKSREVKAKTQEQLGLIEANDRALKAARGRIASIGGEIDKLEAKRKALIDAAMKANNEDIDGILKQLDGLDKDAAKLKTELGQAQTDLEEHIAHREILEAGKKALEKDIADLQARLRKLLGDKNITNEDLSGANSDLRDAKADVHTMNAKDQVLVRHGNGLSDERYKLLEEQKALEALAQLPPEKLSEADKKRLAGRTDLTANIDALTRRIAEANGKRGELAKELDKRMADMKAATARIDAAKVKLEAIETDISEGKQSQAITERDLRKTERELREAAAEIEAALADQKTIRDAMARLDAEQKALKAKKLELEADNDDLEKLKR